MLFEIDENNDGEMSFDEFKKMMELQMKVVNTESDVEKAFSIFDPNSTGYINAGVHILYLTNPVQMNCLLFSQQWGILFLLRRFKPLLKKPNLTAKAVLNSRPLSS